MKGKACPVEDFITFGEFTTKANRVGLLNMLEDTAKVGLENIPAEWTHEANKKEKIFEFIKDVLVNFAPCTVCALPVRLLANLHP